MGWAQQAIMSIPCIGQPVRHVIIRASAPTAASLRRVPVIEHFVAAVHVTTHESLIARFVLMKPGDRCNELRRTESERILRAQPFLADATVDAFGTQDGGVDIIVTTTDEVALVLGGAIGTGSPFVRLLRVGDINLSGQGIFLGGEWRSGTPYRNGYGGGFTDNQFLGRPYTFSVNAIRNPLGNFWEIASEHPFYTDIQRIAWQALAGARDDYIQFANDVNSSHALRLVRNFFDVGGIVRVGTPGRLSLFGASVSGEDERPGALPVLITNQGFQPDSASQLLGRFSDHRTARINALWGVRDIGFAQVRGFDALTATQDMPIGFQLGTVFGRSLSVLGARDDDIFVAGDVYLGAVGTNNALRVQAAWEGRRDNATGFWDGMLGVARALQYFKADSRQTTLASVEFSGGWRERVPFNLTLSDPIGGVRGYASSNTPGARRLVERLEHRVLLGRPGGFGDLGVAVFSDAGQLWRGDIPYGVTTSIKPSIGFSVLSAIPVASARLWRLDLAYALAPFPEQGRFELRFSNTNKTGFFLPDPNDIADTRERSVPSSVFRWPK
jgi:hypothetical protein